MNPDQIAKSLKILGGEARLNIILFLAGGEKCVCKIFKHLKLPQNLVSHHLRVMRENNLITARKTGKWVHYAINPKSIEKITSFLAKILETKQQTDKC